MRWWHPGAGLLGPSDTARIIIVDADASRRSLREEQLSWRGFSAASGGLGDLGGAHAAVVVLDPSDVQGDLDRALVARADELVLVICGPLDPPALQRALHAGVTAWVDADASVPVLTEHLYRGLDAVRSRTLGDTAVAAIQELPLPVMVADAAGRVLVASRRVEGAHPGQDAQAMAEDTRWRGQSLAQGAQLHVRSSPGSSGAEDASVRLAQVAAFAGEAQHEVNNFATYVLANLGALLDEEWSVSPSKEDQIEMTREAHEGARGMVDVVRRLRAAVQVEAAPRCSVVDLVALVQDAAGALGGAISVEAPESLAARVDPPRIARALQQLMRVARDKGEGSAVHVVLTQSRGAAVFRIAGGGRGFDRVAGRKLFSSFLKDPARPGPAADSLSLVAAIAAEHGGGASVREHPDGRRWFVLELPLDEVAPL